MALKDVVVNVVEAFLFRRVQTGLSFARVRLFAKVDKFIRVRFFELVVVIFVYFQKLFENL
jgi:hypothetical protein